MGLDDCDYNCVKQLSKQLKLLRNLDGYIEDAKNCGHEDCVKVFEEIKNGTQKHVNILKDAVKKRVIAGGFD